MAPSNTTPYEHDAIQNQFLYSSWGTYQQWLKYKLSLQAEMWSSPDCSLGYTQSAEGGKFFMKSHWGSLLSLDRPSSLGQLLPITGAGKEILG